MSSASPSVSAAIDIGSNSFRILIGRCDPNLVILKKDLVTVRLAEGLQSNGTICNDALSRAIKAFHYFETLIREYNVKKIRVCGTEAVRLARNSSHLCSHCLHILKAPLEILDGITEAHLTRAAILSSLPHLAMKHCLIVDVGGGSTECMYSGIPRTQSQSFPVGAVTVTEQFFSDSPASSRHISYATEHIKQKFGSFMAEAPGSVATIVGSGGTATSLAALHLGLAEYDADLVHGTLLSRSAIHKMTDQLALLSATAKSEIPCLDDGRGEILLGGALIYRTLFDLTDADHLIVSDAGLLEGIFLSIFKEHFPQRSFNV